MAESRHGKYIVSELKTDRFDTEYNARYAQWTTRILWMDDRVVDGAFQMINCIWYLRPTADKVPEGRGYTHDCDEILGFSEVTPMIPMIWEGN